jgi:hypothetical protein
MNSYPEGKHVWTFGRRKGTELSEKDLKRYQKKLLEIKARHEKDEAFRITHSYFSSPEKLNGENPNDNVFAKFGNFHCSAHGKVYDWRLLWNPNLSDEQSWSFLNNDCIEEDFKRKSKVIQRQIVQEFPEYFNLVDSGPVPVDIADDKENNRAKPQVFDEEFDEKRDYFDDIIYD